ncbi:MAG: endonuclease III [Ignavibacteria bacterium]
MKKSKLKITLKRLSELYGAPYDHSSNRPTVLDVLIATKLSQNTTDKSSFKAFGNLKQKFKNWDNVAKAGIEEIKGCIKVCGLANTKARNIKNMLQGMKKKYGTLDLSFMSEFDNEKLYEEFLLYDGIGVKTISCVLIFALGRDAFPVDTHVHRVLNRLGIVKTNSPERTFIQVKDEIPEGKRYELHSDLIKFGRNICRAKSPLCSICFLYDICEFPEKKFYRKKKPSLMPKENIFIILENI